MSTKKDVSNLSCKQTPLKPVQPGYPDCRYYERRTEKTPRAAVQKTRLGKD